MILYSPYKRLPAPAVRAGSQEAFTLVELVVAISLISLMAASSVYALLSSNRFAATDRARTAAKTSCQERIDQALASAYSPPDLIPSFFAVSGSIPAPNGSPDRGTVTSTETIPLYLDQSDSSKIAVSGTRTTRVSLSDSTLGLVRVWVRLDYTFQGKNRSYERYLVRAPD